MRMPVLFVGHGSPMNALEDNAWTREWERLGRELPKPRAILCLSAHFVTRGLHAVNVEQPETIHDFYGFPQALFNTNYLAPGAPALAERAVELLDGRARTTTEWGLDHGAWSVLVKMYPQADIPVVQLSLDLNLSAKEQLLIGEALSPLRDEGILLLGSGNVVHNLRLLRPGQAAPFAWASAFGERVHSLVLGGRQKELEGYRDFEGALESVNSSEHFVPLLNIIGATTGNDRAEAINHDYVWGSLSMTSYLFQENKETV